jgi:hypothetical protein
MGKQVHPETTKEHVHAINIFQGQMEANKERLKYYAKLLRIPKERDVWPKGMRKGSISSSRRRDSRD